MYGARLERLEGTRPSLVRSPFPSQYILVDRRVDDSVNKKPAFHPQGPTKWRLAAFSPKNLHLLDIHKDTFQCSNPTDAVQRSSKPK